MVTVVSLVRGMVMFGLGFFNLSTTSSFPGLAPPNSA
jgi:hypothetical protein